MKTAMNSLQKLGPADRGMASVASMLSLLFVFTVTEKP
jgi:hypothetical protein